MKKLEDAFFGRKVVDPYEIEVSKVNKTLSKY